MRDWTRLPDVPYLVARKGGRVGVDVEIGISVGSRHIDVRRGRCGRNVKGKVW